MTPRQVEQRLYRERRNPLRWVIGSKAIWIGLSVLLSTTACLIVARAIGAADVINVIAVAIYLIVVIGFFYSRGWLQPNDFDFRFSDQWFRSASAIASLSEMDRRRLMTVAVMNSGNAALEWIRDIADPRTG